VQMSKKLPSLLRKRLSAFFGATVVVVALWLVTVVSVNVFAPSSPLDERERHLPKGVVRLRGGALRLTGPKGRVRVVSLHDTGGNPLNFTAWHTVVQCLILITLAALVVAGLDRLRRKNRKRRSVRMVANL
jgi:hypothetical protein